MGVVIVNPQRPARVVVVERARAVATSVDVSRAVVVDRPGTVVAVDAPPARVLGVSTPGPKGDRGEQGVPGPAGGSALQRIAAANLGGHRIVRTTPDGRVDYADAGNPEHGDDTLGFTSTSAVEGAPVNVLTLGTIEFAGWAWTPGAPVYLGANGLPTQAEPDGAVYQVVGHAETPTSIVIQIQPPIFL